MTQEREEACKEQKVFKNGHTIHWRGKPDGSKWIHRYFVDKILGNNLVEFLRVEILHGIYDI